MRRFLAAPALLCAAAAAARAQQISRDAYYAYLPPRPSIVAQARGSALVDLFGDTAAPGYRDIAPVDGVDDARGARLLAIAEHFSPIMRRNNAVVPRDLEGILGPRPYLQVDAWRGERRVGGDSIALGGAAAGPLLLAGTTLHTSDGTSPNADALRRVVAAWQPLTARTGVASAEAPVDTVLYFDMPGADPRSWRAAVERTDPHRGSRIFAHPFVTVLDDGPAAPRFQLVIQFWFLYPFNNAVNDHEGDWEHINVIATTRAAADATRPRRASAAAVDERAMRAMLDGTTPLDSLCIAAVEYYFHQNVTTLDYVALTDSTRAREAPRDAHYVWEDVDYMRTAVRERVAAAGGRLATHPMVYIGGDDRGPTQLLSLWPRFGGAYKRNSGSSYPFPGTWRTVAGFGVTERVKGTVVPPLREDSTLAWYDLVDDDHWLVYRAADIVLLPDWERLEPLVLTRGDVRARWSWMLLPIYFGFPAVRSTGAGLLKHADLGNIAPMGPAYQSGWNRTGVAADFDEYRIRVLRTPVSPGTPWTAVQNGWGVLNAPIAVWGLMPGYNVAAIELMPWAAGAMHVFGAQPPQTFSPDRLPRRFTTASQGVFREWGGRDFAALLPRAGAAGDALANGGDLHELRSDRAPTWGPRVWFDLYFGDKFAVENSYSISRSALRNDLGHADGTYAGSVLGTLSQRQLTGGVRYGIWSAWHQSAEVYLRGGYGWLWYSASDLRLDGAPLAGSVHGGYLPPLLPSREWWPNTWYGGTGAELFAPERLWLFHRLGYGVRVESSEWLNRLHFDAASAHGDITAHRGDLALALAFGW